MGKIIMSEKSKTEQVKTVKVKLLKPHKHAGTQYNEGVEIILPEHDAAWLKNLNIAEEVGVTPTVSAQPTKKVEEK